MSAQETLGPIVNLSGIDLGADTLCPGVDVSRFITFAFQVVFTPGGGTSAGNFVLQSSLDNVNYDNVEDATLAWDNTTTHHTFEVWKHAAKWYRVFVENTSGSGGTGVVNFFATYEQ